MWELWVFSGDGCQGLEGGKGLRGGVCRLGLYWEGSGQGRWSMGRGKECWWGSRGRKKRGLGLIGVGLIRGRGDGEASRREETWS